MSTRKNLRQYLEQYGMTVAWLSESGHARIGGRPSDPYYEPFPSSLRSDQRNRIPIYKVVGRCKLVFLRALLHDVRPLRVTVAGFIRAPFLSTFFLAAFIYAKLTGKFSEIQAQSEFSISIAEHNRLPAEEFPFDLPLQFQSISYIPGVFSVEESEGRCWRLDTFMLTNVNFIEIEVSEGAPNSGNERASNVTLPA